MMSREAARGLRRTILEARPGIHYLSGLRGPRTWGSS